MFADGVGKVLIGGHCKAFLLRSVKDCGACFCLKEKRYDKGCTTKQLSFVKG